MRVMYFVGVIAAIVGVVGCAKVTVAKVPTPSQYIEWTDDMQQKADKMEGLRYYMPRPFVNVFESFPVRTDIMVAQGVISPDGKYLLLTDLKDNTALAEMYVSNTQFGANPTIPVPLRNVEKIKETLGPLVKLTSQGETAAPTPVAGNTQPAPSSGATQAAPATPAKTGINEFSMKNDNSAFATQPLRGNFDIVYLPDFEEQYAVRSKAGLGNAKVEMNMGQGWSLQGFNSVTDNSALNQRIFDLIDSSVKAAKTAVNFGAASGGIPTLFSQGSATPEDTKYEAKPGTPVSVRIVVVHYAAKGLYPVLKPREIQERKVAPKDKHNFFLINLFDPGAAIQTVSELDPNALQRARLEVENRGNSFTVPRYPYQFISFNTFKYLSVEAIKADSPFGTLYDKTGTKGEVGDRRAEVLPSPSVKIGGKDEQQKAVEVLNKLTDVGRKLADKKFVMLSAEAGDEVPNVVVNYSPVPADAEKPDVEALRDMLFNVIKDNDIPFSKANLVMKPKVK